MYGSSETPRRLSMHAELTISNNAQTDGNALPATHNEQDGSIVRMIYTWTTNSTQEPHLNSFRNVPTTNQPEQDVRSNASYGFQRGNMVFTSTPPHRDINFNPNRLGTSVQDSGYNSDHLFSPNCSFYSQNNPPRRPVPYERRCRSTCSIILSTDIGPDDTIIQNPPQTQQFQQCPRTRPRCQSSNLNDADSCCRESFCRHTETRQNSPLFFSCDECKTNQNITKNDTTNTFTTHFCTKVSEKKRTPAPYFKTKDMMTQTVETREKSTSPLQKMHELNKENKSDSELSKAKRKPHRNTSLRKTPRNSRRNSVTRSNKKDSTASPDSSHKTNVSYILVKMMV